MLDKAERYLKELGASDPAVRMALGAIYLNKSDYDKAIASFERSASLNENDIKIKYNSLGLAYLRKGQYAKAESVLEIAVEFDPNNKYAHNNLGYAYARQGKHHEAGIEFRKALAIDPNYRNAKVNLQGIESRLTPKRTRDR
jgi:tetratricopeptide (TPR) repeat protein